MLNKTFEEAREISGEFLTDYLYDGGIDEIYKVDIKKISVCDKVVFPPLCLDETTDSLCLQVTLKEFSPKTLNLPSMYAGMRVYYRLAQKVFTSSSLNEILGGF